MSFFAILFALLIEQVRPLGEAGFARDGARGWVAWVDRNFDTGKPHHAGLAWSISVLGPSLMVLGLHWICALTVGWPLVLALHVALLYLTLGFRQFSHHFTGIRDALDAGDEQAARELLASWKHIDVGDLPRSEIVRLVVEHSAISAHRHVFGVLAWYSMAAAIGLGPAGAVLYRLAEFVQRRWAGRVPAPDQSASRPLKRAATDLWRLIDWLPARITAVGFAVVGSFEDAVDRWRQHAQRYPDDNDGVILAATAGALNVRLGADVMPGGAAAGSEAAADQGHAPQLGHLAQIVGLVWRTVVMWMVLLALLTLAQLLG